jgi:N-acetylmuramoyl-L-alanine amidase
MRIASKAWLGAVVVLGAALSASALVISNAYSPRNSKRPNRTTTRYVVLHTTEGALTGSLNKVKRYGEAHYLVAPNGHVYRVVDQRRVAFHAGRSMWHGKTNLDTVSIGIEVVGYHNKSITAAQLLAIKELVSQLQRVYAITDERVLTHSMVAYGSPNRWHRRSHRGRKRCGMLFASYDLRVKLGLTSQPRRDPDVDAGRLVVADPYLQKMLYGSAHEQDEAVRHFEAADTHVISAGRSPWDIARERARSAETTYIFPDGSRKQGNEITNWRAIPPGTKLLLGGGKSEGASEGVLVVGRDGESASEIAGDEARRVTTIYFLEDGRVRQGNECSTKELARLPKGTRLLVGYVNGGYVTSKRPVSEICGQKWNFESTYYRFPDGSLRRGSTVSDGAIPPRTMVFFLQ